MLKKTLMCPLNSVNSQKELKTELKTKKLFGIKLDFHYLYTLRYREGFYYLKVFSIISQNRENGRIYT